MGSPRTFPVPDATNGVFSVIIAILLEGTGEHRKKNKGVKTGKGGRNYHYYKYMILYLENPREATEKLFEEVGNVRRYKAKVEKYIVSVCTNNIN